MNQNYVFMNPISLILDKPREDFTREDLIKVIKEKQIKRITFHYTALDGKLKELKLPVTNCYQVERILSEGERVDGSSLFGGIVDTALSDLYVVPLYKTAFLNPFEEGSLDFVCRYLTQDGSLFPFALDNILHKAYQFFRERTNLELYALGELEFFLIRELDNYIYPNLKQMGYHGSAPFTKSGQILNEMLYHISRITGAVKYAHSEVGNIERVQSNLDEIKEKEAEQLEIEFLPTPIEDTGDNLVLGRWLIRNIAYKYNCIATFTPKIEEGIAGNALHVHTELRKNGKNIIYDKDKNLSTQAKKIIGGLCTYADSLTAFGNTVASSYFRLVPNQEAPIRICWGELNRSAMIRVPLGWLNVKNLANKLNPQQKVNFEEHKCRQTVEFRTPDGSAIIHLLLAGMTMAAEWGLTNPDSIKTTSRLHVTRNVFQNKKLLNKLPSLPRSCIESSRVMFQKRSLYERENIFPRSTIEYIIKLLQGENDENLNQYIKSLPLPDRLYEIHKIMHRDLHRH